jgi:HMGL-like
MSTLEIVEVGPRDGLQNEDVLLDVAAKVAYIEALAAAGLRRIEAVSFVHPSRVPQMAGAEAVMAAVPRPDGVRYSGLVLNRRGVERAVAAGVDEINMVVVATDTFSAKNQGMTTAEGIRATAGIAGLGRKGGLPGRFGGGGVGASSHPHPPPPPPRRGPAGDADGGRGVRLPVRGRGPAGTGDGHRPAVRRGRGERGRAGRHDRCGRSA